MTVLETFMAFAKRLPADRLQSVEDTLAMLMETHSEQNEFTDAELAEIDRRVAASDPQFADPGEIEKLFVKPFNG